MKKLLITIILLLYVVLCFSQIHRKIKIKPFIDTTSVEFNNIFGLWKGYMDTLFVYNSKAHFKIKKTNESINSFWTQYDIDHYFFPDLYYALTTSYGGAYYPFENEYFLGFSKRGSNLYEIRTMFVNPNEELFLGCPDIMLSVPVIKTGNTYKLYNKFSLLLKEKRIITEKFNNVTYYYSPLYKFNNDSAKLLNSRIEKFKQGFGIKSSTNISYLTADNMTELLEWFGINYYQMDYNASLSKIEGRAIKINDMILSGGGGENFLHEIIHILLKGFRKGKHGYFEEGIACYFGDHQGKSFAFHAKRLKRYLKENNWIDLSENLMGFYNNSDKSHSYKTLVDKNSMRNFHFYSDSITNFTYIIYGAICEMAFQQGGYNEVKDILCEKADNVDEFYGVIEKYLGIKRKDVNRTIRNFLNANY